MGSYGEITNAICTVKLQCLRSKRKWKKTTRKEQVRPNGLLYLDIGSEDERYHDLNKQ